MQCVVSVVTMVPLWLLLVLPLAAPDGDVRDTGEFHPRDCHDHKVHGARKDKVYIVYPGGRKTAVWCDGMGGNDTAWTVIQRRRDGQQDFKQGWVAYKGGFGQREVDHWVGNEALHLLTLGTTNTHRYELRIELQTWDTPSVHKHADYSDFTVGAEVQLYKLMYANYSGDAGDSLRFHRGRPFSTPDRDNDEWPAHNCAAMLDSGWWFTDCGSSNLNGQFYRGRFNPMRDCPYRGGIWWFGMGDFFHSFRSLMKIRPILQDATALG